MHNAIIHIPHEICDSCSKPSGPSLRISSLPNETELLRNNIMPPDTYLDSKSTASAKDELSLLNTEITHLQNVLSSLQKRRDEIHQFVFERSSLLAPIRRLPEDLLGHIFFFCQHASFDDHGSVTICNPTTFVRVITRVSSFWRNVALNYPLLWSHVYVDFHVKRGRNITSVLRMIGPFLSQCIRRSGEAPLTLSFSRTCTPKLFSLDVLEEIAKCAWRWEDLQIGWELLEKVQIEFQDSVPCLYLKRLTILDDVPENQHLVFHRDMPALTEITIRAFTNPVQRLMFPWSQITKFTSDSNIFERDELHTLLTSMPNLTSLQFFGNTGRQATQTAIPLPKLKTLHLSGDFVQIVNQLRSFNSPRLKNLKLDCGTSFLGELYQSSVLPFLRRSNCHLDTLILHGIPLSKGWDDEEVKNVRRLEVHRLSSDRFVDDLWWLTRYESNDPDSLLVLPNLEALELHFDHDVEYNLAIEDLKQMLKSRFWSGRDLDGLRYLSEVSINFTRELKANQVGMLKMFIEEVGEARYRNVKMVVKHGFFVNGRRMEGRIL
ncbi:hypothetical protein BDQ17DRAFT_1541581 [Cyathus striatus]|nr:hypothetical protein BDQ17DRAFT_1541581 [Cyathus striatus]